MGRFKKRRFSDAEPWLKVADNYKNINTENTDVSQAIRDYYKTLIRLRKDMPIIQEGSYDVLELEHPSIFAYVREYEGEKLLVLNHFYGEDDTITIPDELLNMDASYLIGNGSERKLDKDFKLGPYETAAFLLK